MDWSDFLPSVRHLSSIEIDRIHAAFDLGKKAHDGQLRKSGEPYFTHPIAVAQMLASWGADEDTIIAGLLHDTVEDTDLTLEEIDKQFNGSTRLLIDGVTKLEKQDIEHKPTLDEKIETLRKIFGLIDQDVRIVIIKLADRLHNMRTSAFLPEAKKLDLARETMDFYVKIAGRISMADVEDELESICLQILHPEEYTTLAELRKTNLATSDTAMHQMMEVIKKRDPDFWKHVSTQSEPKRWLKLRLQAELEDGAVTGLASANLIFVCPDVDTCYRVIGTLHQLWKRETLSFEDYINAPMINGYQALHTTIILGNGKRVRCKIRTQKMDEYAHRGVTTLCFDNHERGLSDHLSWMKNIGPLTSDSRDRSSDFWQSLQSDILGDYITIHGPADELVNVPTDATALDGLFYLFGDQALRASSARVNGKHVPFDTSLKHGESVSGTFTTEDVDHRQWLEWVQTGVAAAAIRRSLSTVSKKKKMDIGKDMLQTVLTERKGGFIDEFDEKRLLEGLRRIGYGSLKEAFIAIANGNVTPYDVFQNAFQRQRKNPGTKKRHLVVRYSIDLNSSAVLDRISSIHKKYIETSDEIHYKRAQGSHYTVVLRYDIAPEVQEQFLQELRSAGAANIRVETKNATPIRLGFCALLFFIWGMDPVFAHAILQHGISPIDFTIVRIGAIFVLACATFFISQWRYAFSLLPLKNKSIWISGIAFFGVGFLSYQALQHGSPSFYNSILRGNTLLIAITSILLHKKEGPSTSSMIITFIGYGLLLFIAGFSKDMLLCLGVLAAFFIYTLSSTHFQQQQKVLARYPQFFLYTSGIALLCTLFILPQSTVFHLPLSVLALLGVYSGIFIGLPYILFFWVTKHYGYSTVSPWIAVSLVLTFFGEALLYGIDSVEKFIPAALFLIAGSLLSSRQMREL